MTDNNRVDAAITAYLDFLEGAGPEPSLDELSPEDRAYAEDLIQSLRAGRGIDPHASRPSLEALLVGSEFENVLAQSRRDAVSAHEIRQAVTEIEPRAHATVDAVSGLEVVTFSLLDLRVRFTPLDVMELSDTAALRAVAARVLNLDPETSHVAVIAARTSELTTQVLAADDVGPALSTPRGDAEVHWQAALPLDMALRQLVERAVPQWDRFDLDSAFAESPDVAAIAEDIAARVIAREAGRPFKGDKGRAYKALLGHESLIAGLVTKLGGEDATALDLSGEVDRVAQAAA